MTSNAISTANLLFAYSAYFVGTASPGPSNLAIMSIATTAGRKAAFTFAAGVISGSFFWATLATLGLSATLMAYSGFLVAVKVFGGLYLLWLAFKSGRSAISGKPRASAVPDGNRPLSRLYVRGALLHLTNPKAILVWISVVALASPAGASGQHMAAVVGGCLGIGLFVFGSYAALFSTSSARRVYAALRRWLEGCLAVVFGIAGIRLLTSHS
jgi:threonine/homoserine/homoserine lactone efflux protein